MKRFYFLSNTLDELEMVEKDLLEAGIQSPQIHVLSLHDAEAERHHLHSIHSFLRTDVIHAALKGALFGVVAAALLIVTAHFQGWAEETTWAPFVFCAIVLIGFSTWEASFFGFQIPNSRFKRFQKALLNDRHVLFIDVHPSDEKAIHRVLCQHPTLEPAGTGSASPRWVVNGQQKLVEFVHWAP